MSFQGRGKENTVVPETIEHDGHTMSYLDPAIMVS